MASNSSVFSRPVHVDIRPRDNYQHHVYVENIGDIISWSFFTRKKNVAFGLFYVHKSKAESPPDSPRRLSNMSVGETRRSSAEIYLNPSESKSQHEIISATPSMVREAIFGSRLSVVIEPSASPKPGHGSTSVPASRTNSIQPNVEDSVDLEGALSRARTVDEKPDELESILKQNASLPNLRAYAPSSMTVTQTTEYLEILPVERYESFDSTINGHYIAPLSGDYVLYFDNSYSVNTSKELFLTVSVGPTVPASQETFSGWLMKKKQKRLQGWARRWFQLDRKGILSYYEDRFSPCRGSIDLHHCTIAKNPQRLMMTIDSGSDTYHLRAMNPEDYSKWSEHFNMIRMQNVHPHALFPNIIIIGIRRTKLVFCGIGRTEAPCSNYRLLL